MISPRQGRHRRRKKAYFSSATTAGGRGGRFLVAGRPVAARMLAREDISFYRCFRLLAI